MPTHADAAIRVHLLGRFEVERDGEPLPRTLWKRRRPVELLTALALASGRVMHREDIIDRLWPDKDLDAGANNLYRTLHELRKSLGEGMILAERGTVTLGPDVWIDVEAFETAVSEGTPDALRRAVDLYRGDLLPDDPYGEAIGPRREGLRQRFVDAGLRLARTLELPDSQIDVLRRLLEIDPTLEEAHRGLMFALAATGRKKDALRQYAACVRALREQLDTEPSPETHDLRHRIDDDAVATAPAPAPTAAATATPSDSVDWSHVALRLLGTAEPPPIHGRPAALDAIGEFARSQSGLLLVVAEAGLGKTRLAVECARRCSERGDALMVGLGYDFEGTAPYTPFVDAWADHLRAQGRSPEQSPFATFEPVPGASAQEDRMRLFQGVERSLVETAGTKSVCLIIEDLHQADESSLYLLYHLARACRQLPLKIVATIREEDVRVGAPLHTVLGGLGRERLAHRIVLERLDLEATRALAQDLTGRVLEDGEVARIHRLCEGNPFFTEEVVRMMEADGFAGRPALSEDLQRTLRERIHQLGRDAERLLVMASVAGSRFGFEVVRTATGMEPDAALDALDAALDARVIEEFGEQYRFHHALTRETLYATLSHARRVYLHRALADAIESQAADPRDLSEVLAYHHREGGQIERALPHLMTAIERAQKRLGFGEAVAFSGQALELMDTLGMDHTPDRFAVVKSMGAMRVALGDLGQAIEDLDTAAAMGQSGGWRPTAVQRANALRLAGLAMIEAGKLDSAEDRLERALEALAEEPDSPELSNVYYLFSQLRWHQARHTDAYALAEQCLLEAERHGDESAIARGYEMLALACHSLGDWKKGTEFEERRTSLCNGPLDVASAFDVHL